MGAQHPTEADSVPPWFKRIHQKTPEEHEATRYRTPTDSKQSIDEELGIQDVTNITEDWYAQSELASAVKSVLQLMVVDEPLEEPPRISDEEAPDMLGPNPGSGSPVTATEDRALDTPGGFSRAPGVTGDQSPDPRPVPPADGLRDAPQRDRCQDLGLGRRPWILSVTDEIEGMAWKKMED